MMTAAAPETTHIVGDFIDRTAGAPLPRLYGEALLAAARQDPRIVCLTADLAFSTETDLFRSELPDRFFEAGIAEANMIGMAGGMARSGDIPFVHSFCVFATRRCYDQIAVQVAYPALPVKIVGFLPGLTTLLGISHQAIDDVALMRALPNMTIIEPSGPEQMASAVAAALAIDGPVYLRMKRPEAAVDGLVPRALIPGRGELLRRGNHVAIIASGLPVAEAMLAADILAGEDIMATVVNMATIKPLDTAMVIAVAGATGAVVTVENHSIIGGLGSAVAETLLEAGVVAGFRRVGVLDTFAEGGSTAFLQEKYGLVATDIVRACREAIAAGSKLRRNG